MEFPVSFTEKMKNILQDEYEDFLKGYDRTRHYGLRVNRTKLTAEQFERMAMYDLAPVPWIDNAFEYEDSISPAKHPYYFAGLYYLQEPSAMTPANLLPIEPGDRVLDICAAPGGKATELGAKLDGTGVLMANDISNSRAKGLLKNIEVFGIGNVLVLSEEPGKLESYFPEYFDKILIDAPCSGEGMFRKDKKMVKAWEEHGPEFFAKIQRSIVTQAARMLKPGGMILYSTCTFDPEENEGTIEYLLEQYPEFVIKEIRPYEGFACGKLEVTESKDEAFSKTVRIWPHKMHGEGHYLALLQKGEAKQDVQKDKPKKSNKKVPEEILEFFKDISWEMDWNRLEIYSEKVYYMPEGVPDVKGIRFLRTGLYLGDLKKNRFEPSQSLAMCLKKEEYSRCVSIPADDERIIKYLKGETIDVDDLVSPKDKGWFLVLVDGYPLGWGKLANGTLKNKYLPGWRWMSS